MTLVTRIAMFLDTGRERVGHMALSFAVFANLIANSELSIGSSVAAPGEGMTATTYELTAAPNGASVLRCLLCRGESSDSDSVQRLHCSHCSWFHEPCDERRLDLVAHITTATGEVQAALEIAESVGDEAVRIESLQNALRELRRALSRA